MLFNKRDIPPCRNCGGTLMEQPAGAFHWLCVKCKNRWPAPAVAPLDDKVQLCRHGTAESTSLRTQPCNCQPGACRLGRVAAGVGGTLNEQQEKQDGR